MPERRQIWTNKCCHLPWEELCLFRILSFSSHFYFPEDLTAKYFCGKGWLFLRWALVAKGKWEILEWQRLAQSLWARGQRRQGQEGRHPPVAGWGAGKTHTGLLGAPECRLAEDSCAAVGPVGLREAVFIYCCSEVALLASGQGGPQQGGESQERSQSSESREDASLEQPVMQTPGGQLGRVDVWSLASCGFLKPSARIRESKAAGREAPKGPLASLGPWTP